MLTHCVRHVLSRRLSSYTSKHGTRRGYSTSQTDGLDQVSTLLQPCVDRYYISPGQPNVELFQRGMCCSYGPLGMELRRNLLDQWWHSVTRSRAQVFGINTLSSSTGRAEDELGQLRIVESEHLKQILDQKEQNMNELIQEAHTLLQRSPSMRRNLLQGKLTHDISLQVSLLSV